MIAEFKFLRVTDRRTRYAKAVVQSEPSGEWELAQGASVSLLARVYGDAVQQGVLRAVGEHKVRGGDPHRVIVVEVIESAVDTSADVLESAVAVATWKSLGHDETEAKLEAQSGKWTVRFESASKP